MVHLVWGGMQRRERDREGVCGKRGRETGTEETEDLTKGPGVLCQGIDPDRGQFRTQKIYSIYPCK